MMMKKATQQEAVAVTWVFWDIKMCPVPTGFHPRLVRPSIKRLLEKNGYGGPLTITAYGKLADLPIDMLRDVFSSGIDLKIVPYGTIDIFDLMATSHETNPPPANFMFLSYGKACCGLSEVLEMDRYNPLQPFPIDSLDNLLMEATNSGALDEETLESAFWDCRVCSCYPPSQCFESFITHLCDEDHLEELMLITRTPPPTALEDFPLVPLENPPFISRCHQDKLSKLPTISVPLQHLSAPLSEAPQKNLEAVTLVFWDIKMCPVPRGCHPRRVGPCIKLFLKNKGYSAPLTITAIGVLKDVPNDVLEGVYSGGVSLNNICTGFSSTVDRLLCDFTSSNPPPANIMVISDAKSFTDYSSRLESRGYNILRCDSLESFFLADSGALDDDKCSESAFWICSLCHMDLGGQGFDNYTTHVNSRRHQRELLLDDLPSNQRFTRAEPPRPIFTRTETKLMSMTPSYLVTEPYHTSIDDIPSLNTTTPLHSSEAQEQPELHLQGEEKVISRQESNPELERKTK